MSSEAWWDEFEEVEEKKREALSSEELCFHCKLIIYGGLEAIQWIDEYGKIHNVYVKYCPMCGNYIEPVYKKYWSLS